MDLALLTANQGKAPTAAGHTHRPHKHTHAEMEERHRQHEAQVRAEQIAAQVSVIACQIPHDAINAGILKSIVVWRETRKSKAEWNSERKREVPRMSKPGGGPSKEEKAADGLERNFELHGKADYSNIIESDPVPYIRSYNFLAFQLALKGLHPKQAAFGAIRILDFGGQLLGDARLIEAIGGLKKCPVRVLNIGYNEITDKGMTELARNMRSMGFLVDLILAGNHFTDRGVQAIMEENVYSPTLRKIDLSCNNLGPRSAYFLGLMFSPERQCKLESLFLGGKVGKKGWGNEFVRVLVEHLCRPNTRPLRRLSIPAAALSSDGINSLAALLACSKSLQMLNMTKNTLDDPESRDALRHALRINTSLEEFYYRQSGLNKAQRDALAFASKSTYKLTWHEKVSIAQRTALELRQSLAISSKIELDIFNNWQVTKPPSWPLIEGREPNPGEVDSDMLASHLVDLTASMGLVKSIVATVRSLDFTVNYTRTMIQISADALAFLLSSLEAAEREPDASLQVLAPFSASCDRRNDIAALKRLETIGALEKFSGIKACVVGHPSAIAGDEEGKKKNIKGAKKAKAGGININTLLMSMEDYRSACIELGDSHEEYISEVFVVKNALDSDTAEKAENEGLVRGAAASFIAAPRPKRGTANWIPSQAVVGSASAFVHYVYSIAPAERLRAHRSLEAYEREQKRLADIEAKEARKKLKVLRGGPRFQITRGVGVARGPDPGLYLKPRRADIASSRGSSQDQAKGSKRRTAVQMVGMGGVGEDHDDSDDNSASDDGGGDDDFDVSTLVRDVTRFTVPKRDLQKKYETLQIEDLTDNEATIRKIQEYLARNGRSVHVRRSAVELCMPRTVGLNFIEGQVTFDVYTEVEEERSEPVQHLTRLNTTRQAVALEARVRDRKFRHQLERERALG